MALKEKVVTLEEAASQVKSGQTLMVGGFAGTGNPVDVLVKIVKNGVRDLTLIANDTGTPQDGINLGYLITEKAVKKVIASHIGTNPETCRQYGEGEIEVEFVPQGTLAERIRCGGFGLGGVVTPTGVGTQVAEGKQILTIDGKEYLLEKPLHADVAVVRAKKADKIGNLCFHGTNIAHGAMMLFAADTTIVQADEIVEVGEIAPDDVDIPSILVDYVVQGGTRNA